MQPNFEEKGYFSLIFDETFANFIEFQLGTKGDLNCMRGNCEEKDKQMVLTFD